MNDNNTHEGPSNRVPPLAPGSALAHACRLAEELRESDAAGYSMLETSVMALYFEMRRLRVGMETILRGGYAPGADVAHPAIRVARDILDPQWRERAATHYPTISPNIAIRHGEDGHTHSRET